MTGTVQRIVADRGFGFVKSDDNGIEYFFHRSAFDGHWDDLVGDSSRGKRIQASFDIGDSPKGPRAENVKRLDGGV